MKTFHKIFISLLLFYCFQAFSQPVPAKYGNEWIRFDLMNSSQQYPPKYFKIKIVKEGIYKLTTEDLINAKFPETSVGSGAIAISPKKLQLFHLGIEEPLWVNGDLDGILQDSGDFIAFYANKNLGQQDSLMFEDDTSYTNNYYSILSDTAAYFLTWDDDTNHLRYSDYTNTTFTGLSPETYFMHEEFLSLNDVYYPEYPFSSEKMSLSEYVAGEGWFGNAVGFGTMIFPEYAVTATPSINYNIPVKNKFTGSPGGSIDILLHTYTDMGISPEPQYHQHFQLRAGTNIILEKKLRGYGKHYYSVNLSNADIDSSNTIITLEAFPISGIDKEVIVPALIRLSYPKKFELNNSTSGKFILSNPQVSGDYYLRISGYPTGTISPKIIDVTNKRVIYVLGGNPLEARVPREGNKQILFLENILNENYANSPKLKEINFRQYFPKDTAYNYLIVCTDSLKKSANDYKTYRSTSSGGLFKPLVITATEIYNQFSYGEFHPMGVRRMANYFIKEGDSIPKALLIIGNSMNINNKRKTPSDLAFVTSIPPFGYPSSDAMYTSGLTKKSFMPSIPTGRIAFFSNQKVKNYLNKVIGFELSDNIGMWGKNIFQLSGGKNPYEQAQFRDYLKGFENVASGNFFGARVTNLFKDNSDPIYRPDRKSIHALIDNGVSLITFFGHSTNSVTELDLGDPEGDSQKGDPPYKNYKKYPLMIMNGCYTGNVFGGGENSIGQKWLSAIDKGALGFIGHIDQGFPYPLQQYTYSFYLNACRKMFEKTWGECIQKTIDNMDSLYQQNTSDRAMRTHARQVIFQGDPVIRFIVPKKPDYKISESSLFIYTVDKNGDPADVSATSDSFAIGMIVENRGKAIDDSIRVSVHRIFPPELNTDTIYKQIFSHIYNVDTITFWIKSKDIRTKGENTFEIKIDFPDSVKELDETNNFAQIKYIMPTDGVNIISPYKYSIVNTTPIQLVAQSNDILKGYRFYKFEIDTSFSFASPLHQISPRIKSQWLPVWVPDTNMMVKSGGKLKDSVVYYWRVKVDTTFIEGGFWENSSFVFIRYSPTGWSQSHYNQFTKAILTNINLDTNIRKWNFAKTTIEVNIKSIGTEQNPDPCSPGDNPKTQIKVNSGILGFECGNITNGMAFKIFDPTFESYIDSNFALTNGYTAYNYYQFWYYDTTNMRIFLNNIPDNYIVFCWQVRKFYVQNWNDALFKAFGPLGVEDSLRTLKDYFIQNDTMLGFIFISTKGQPGKYKWVQGKTSSDIIRLDTVLEGNWYKGTYLSERIGPAQSWDSLYFQMKSIENPSTDKFSIDVIGIGYNRFENTILTHQKILNDTSLSSIPAGYYPFIRLKLNCLDTGNVSPVQLHRWQVTYEGVPEGTLNPFDESLTGNPFAIDTLDEGEILNYELAFHNISNIKFKDSILVKYTVTTADRQKKLQPYRKFKPLLPDSVFYLPGGLNTFGLKGENTLEVEVNPDNKQPELYHSNNVLRYGFYVVPDITPPLLDVAVDGKHIMNGDIVSPNPVILARLKDENKYLPLNDTNQITLLFKKLNDTISGIINYNNARVLFHAADDKSSNNSELEFRPGHLDDGFYELRVRAKDRTGNPSGSRDYVITFEVINESTISYFYPYPNPFSTRTRFVYTLTGNFIPRNIRIQILTITGKVVREITGNELGNLRIGNNVSDFTWDGTDEFGDKLANGLYLYRVIIEDPENEYKHRETSGDKYFKNSIGKMYILR